MFGLPSEKGHSVKGRKQPKETPMSAQTAPITQELLTYMEKAFPPKPYRPGMPFDEVAYNEGTQAPINRLKEMLERRNKRQQ